MKRNGVSYMLSLIKGRSVFYSPLALYTLGAAFIFSLGFFIHFGKEAHASKSWEYVMYDRDAVYYWNLAKGRMMTPRCDGNPFYYEAQGLRQIIPSTAADMVGLLSKYTRIPLSWFLPLWNIWMPLFIWFVIVVCCWKLWNYPLGTSAAGAMILLLSSLFCPYGGISTTILYRFPRPMDGIAFLFLWISLIFKGDPSNKKHGLAVIFVSALALWLQPLYAVFGLWITAFEYLYSLFCREGFLKAKLHLYAIGSCIVSGLFFAGYALFGKNLIPGQLSPALSSLPLSFSHCFMTVPMVLFAMLVIFFFHVRLGRKISPLDRLVIEWTLFGVFVYFATTQIPIAREAPIHMLYFFPIMLFSLAGWIHEKFCALKEANVFRQFSHVFMMSALAFLIFSVISRKNLFAAANWNYYAYCTQYFFILLFFLWLPARFVALSKWVTRKEVVCGIILLLAIVGYWKMPVNEDNRNFPFDGAYRWLAQHARKNDVVLTASLKYRYAEYLFLKTGLKSYYYEHAETPRTPVQIYRRDFVMALLLGALDNMPQYARLPLDQKLRVFKLDYILMPNPSPFVEAVTTQLGGRLQLVYQDKQCWLWKVF